MTGNNSQVDNSSMHLNQNLRHRAPSTSEFHTYGNEGDKENEGEYYDYLNDEESVLDPNSDPSNAGGSEKSYRVSHSGRRSFKKLREDHEEFCELFNLHASKGINTARRQAMRVLKFTYFQFQYHYQKYLEAGSPAKPPYTIELVHPRKGMKRDSLTRPPKPE